MSLKSIRESYSKLLSVFNSAGVKLNESQKSSLDSFILALESTMSNQREKAIKMTKKAVTKKLECECKRVFESVMNSMQENNALAAKIQDLRTKLVESKKLAGKVDDYLDLYVESILPKKKIVDYDRMQKLEKLHESLKDLLVVNEDSVQRKKKYLDESFKSSKSKCETEVAKLQVKLNESLKKQMQLKKKIDQLKAVELLESKTKDLPSFEARAVKKQLAEASTSEIERKFGRVLESVKKRAKKIAEAKEAEDETTLESEIDKIVNDDEIEENDLLNNRNHNLHVSEAEEEIEEAEDLEEDDMLNARPHNGAAQHNAHVREAEEEIEEEDFETTEEVKEDEEGNIQLDDSDVIDENLMRFWCNKAIEVR